MAHGYPIRTHEEKVNAVIDEIEEEMEDYHNLHSKGHMKESGITSSQISALVGFLIKKGIIK